MCVLDVTGRAEHKHFFPLFFYSFRILNWRVTEVERMEECERCKKGQSVVEELQACLNQVVSGYDREIKR